MKPLERLKRRVASRLTGDVDVQRFKDSIDNKVAKLTYKNREIILEKRSNGFVMFLGKTGEYTYNQDYHSEQDEEGAINEAREIIKNDERWNSNH